MKVLNKYIVLVILAMFGYSCGDDFLDLKPPLNVADDQFLLTLDDYNGAIAGAYDLLQDPDLYGRYFILIPDIMGNDVKQNASANRGADWAAYGGGATTTQQENREFIERYYQVINAANAIINREFTPPSGFEDQYNQVVGEAHALRALAHFDLVRLFGQHYTFTTDASHLGMPVVLEFDPEARPVRNTVGEVYNQVVQDLQDAIGLMTIDKSDKGNAGSVTREAAQALLSRVYLYMEDWDNAETQATSVINSGIYSLVDSAGYPNQFLDGNSPESIFEIVFSATDNVGSDHIGGMYKSTGYGDYLPSQDLLDLFQAGDVRSTMFSLDPNLDGGIYASADGLGRRVDKYPSSGASIATDNVPVIRLSEVYLIRAEARAKKASPDDVGALADLNMVHMRSVPSGTPYAGLSGQALIDEILRERKRELCFEGHGIFDITRNGLDLVRVDCTAPAEVCTVTYPDDRFILAIHQDELDANPNMVQNPSY